MGYLSEDNYSQQMKGPGTNYLSTGEIKQTGGGGMEPMTAGMMVGGSFLSNLMAQKAKEEEARKAAALQAVQTQLDSQGQGNKLLMEAWARGLGGIK